jgi:hypothetical protein
MDVRKSLITFFLNKIKLFRNTQDRDYSGLHTWLSTQDLCGCRRLRVIRVLLSNYSGLHTWLSTQDLCGCRRLRVILVLLSNYPRLHTWLSTQDLCGGFHLGVILTLKVYKGLKKCFDLENIG